MKSTHALVACAFATAGLIAGCSDNDSPDEGPVTLAVSKASCGSGDRPETALQGQVTAAQRQAGFTGTNCNLELVGQYKGEGGNWSSATFRDKSGKACAYHSTAAPALANGTSRNRPTPGVPVINITNPAAPVRTMSLTTPAMLDSWESLRVNERRQILIGDNGQNGGGGPEIDIYDLSGDCANPQLLSSTRVGSRTDDVVPPRPVVGHEGNIAPDGLTYYVGNTGQGQYHAVDIANLTKPKVLATFDMRDPAKNPLGGPHGLSVSADGNRMYGVGVGFPTAAQVADPNFIGGNGFLILDTSDVQARRANPQIRLVGSAAFKDGTIAQHTIPIKIGGKPYVVMVDEGGSGGIADATGAFIDRAAAANLLLFPVARIYDVSDEKNPKVVSKMALETHDPANAAKVKPDLTGLTTFTYGSHYCSVDNRENATALACAYMNSGIRVFDIRNAERPREIAYFNPPGVAAAVPGSNHADYGGGANAVGGGKPDWCASRMDFDFARKTLTTMCQDNGLLVLRFTNDSWPFSQSTPSTDQN